MLLLTQRGQLSCIGMKQTASQTVFSTTLFISLFVYVPEGQSVLQQDQHTKETIYKTRQRQAQTTTYFYLLPPCLNLTEK